MASMTNALGMSNVDLVSHPVKRKARDEAAGDGDATPCKPGKVPRLGHNNGADREVPVYESRSETDSEADDRSTTPSVGGARDTWTSPARSVQQPASPVPCSADDDCSAVEVDCSAMESDLEAWSTRIAAKYIASTHVFDSSNLRVKAVVNGIVVDIKTLCQPFHGAASGVESIVTATHRTLLALMTSLHGVHSITAKDSAGLRVFIRLIVETRGDAVHVFAAGLTFLRAVQRAIHDDESHEYMQAVLNAATPCLPTPRGAALWQARTLFLAASAIGFSMATNGDLALNEWAAQARTTLADEGGDYDFTHAPDDAALVTTCELLQELTANIDLSEEHRATTEWLDRLATVEAKAPAERSLGDQRVPRWSDADEEALHDVAQELVPLTGRAVVELAEVIKHHLISGGVQPARLNEVAKALFASLVPLCSMDA